MVAQKPLFKPLLACSNGLLMLKYDAHPIKLRIRILVLTDADNILTFVQGRDLKSKPAQCKVQKPVQRVGKQLKRAQCKIL